MPNSTSKDNTQNPDILQMDALRKDKAINRTMNQINNMIGQANLSVYGTDRTSDVDKLNSQFQTLLNSELETITTKNPGDITSFLNQVCSSDNKETASDNLLENQFGSLSGDEYSSMQSFIYDAYRNRLLEQSDLHEISSQLIELSEAILITRDAIISADVVEGRMSRTLSFSKTDDDDEDSNIAIVKSVEKKFKLLEKIKNFIVPKTLEYGEYYAYAMPYSKIFNDFMSKKKNVNGSRNLYRESTVLESTELDYTFATKNSDKKSIDVYAEELYKEYCSMDDSRLDKKDTKRTSEDKKFFVNDIKTMLGNISVCNESVPLPILEEGFSSMEEYMTEYVSESGDYAFTEAKSNMKGTPDKSANAYINNLAASGITFDNGKKKGSKKDKKGEFDEIKDCYVKLLDPTKVIPIEIMNQVIGYYYVVAEDISPVGGMVSSTLYYSKFDNNRKEQTIIDSIAERIIASFDKKFLMNNLKFKKTIVEAINYYNLNENRLKFQFIPVEYMQLFKIDEDENGHGQSMIKKSLFYAKLYLMILLFKIMSIILYSNDQKVNYIKQSGIDKDVANKVQEIARIDQSRQINMTDLFNYTTLINKVGNGNQKYIPTGRSGERPIETEILSGQDVQLNTELLEMLKNAYILGTGVPAAIVNYMNEADFAKVIEQNNTKFNGRVVNYQLDFNESITEFYKKILRWSTNIPENLIDNFEFTLQPPKQANATVKAEVTDNFDRVADFLTKHFYDDPDAVENGDDVRDEIKEWKKLLIEDMLPMIDVSKMEELKEKAKIRHIENKVRPKPENGDDGDDGMGDFQM